MEEKAPQSARAIFDQVLEIESQLEAHASAGAFLEAPVAIAAAPTLEAQLLMSPPGSVIDRYKLLEPIGEGAHGTVYMAEQTSPVQRKVSLKIIKAGMDSKQVIARFEAERQAL